MRIIGGKCKGRRLNAPKSIKARPTTDFAKESLFNILSNRTTIEGKNILDLFEESNEKIKDNSQKKNVKVERSYMSALGGTQVYDPRLSYIMQNLLNLMEILISI